MLAELSIGPRLLRPFHLVYTNFISSHKTLEPAQELSRTGERGKRISKAKGASESRENLSARRVFFPTFGDECC